MRIAAILVLGGVLAVLPGCDRLTAEGARKAFELRCRQLPAGRVEVVSAPGEPVVDESLSRDELEGLVETTSSRHRTVGVTTAAFGYRSTLEIDGLEDARGGRACAQPRVRIEIGLAPMTVYVASEYRDDACRKPLILEHERLHVEVFERYAARVARELPRDLAAHLGGPLLHGPSMLAIQESFKADLARWLEAFMDRSRNELDALNARIDTTDEYGKLARVCGPAS